DQNARPSFVAGLLDYRQVAAQATVCPRERLPCRWVFKGFTVQRRKSNHLFDIVLRESGQHFFPAIAPLIQVDANLIWEEIVKIHRSIQFPNIDLRKSVA